MYYSYCSQAQQVPSSVYFDAETTELVRNQFKAVDSDHSGTVDLREVTALFSAIGEPVSDKDAQSLIKEVDLNDDGTIDFTEFCVVCDYCVKELWFNACTDAAQTSLQRSGRRWIVSSCEETR